MEYASADYLRTLFFPLLLAIPSFLVIVLGIGFNIFNYKKAPKASIFSMVALLIFGVLNLVGFVQPILTIQLMQGGIQNETFTYILGTIAVLTSLFGAIALSLLVISVWLGRSES